MTGFCKTEVTLGDLTCDIELRSVNHRFLEARIFLPKQFQYLDEELKKQLKKSVRRGKVDISLTVNGVKQSQEKLVINPALWENLKNIKKELQTDLQQELDISMSDVLGVKGLLVYEQEEIQVEDYEQLFQEALEKGIQGLLAMRAREGELLQQEILTHVVKLQELVAQVPKFEAEVTEKYRQRLEKNLQYLDVKYDQHDPRIMQEIGLFLDRSDVSEEIERTRTHLTHLGELLNLEEPVGRKLDFMLQELNREANTLCSKASCSEMTAVGVEMKCEVEKIREQIQNIE